MSQVICQIPFSETAILNRRAGLTDRTPAIDVSTHAGGRGPLSVGTCHDRTSRQSTKARGRPPVRVLDVRIPPLGLMGTVQAPRTVQGFIVFAHGSGSSRLRPRNTRLADSLNGHGLATLLFDLLTDDPRHMGFLADHAIQEVG